MRGGSIMRCSLSGTCVSITFRFRGAVIFEVEEEEEDGGALLPVEPAADTCSCPVQWASPMHLLHLYEGAVLSGSGSRARAHSRRGSRPRTFAPRLGIHSVPHSAGVSVVSAGQLPAGSIFWKKQRRQSASGRSYDAGLDGLQGKVHDVTQGSPFATRQP